jgi:molecular chaperone DnaJ
MGTFSSVSNCQRCGGTGKIIKSPCKACRGTGAVRKQRKVTVHVPSGIDDGQTVSLRGLGSAGKRGGPPGDLLVAVSVEKHALFQREGNSVLCEVPITFIQAVLGAELEIPTIDGKVKYTLPEGTQTGTTVRFRGKGIPNLGGRGRGDQYVTFFVEVPRNLNGTQKEALRNFGETLTENNHGRLKNFFDLFKK